jgi:hypothetical protein
MSDNPLGPVRMGKEELFATLERLERGEPIHPEVMEFFIHTVRYMEGQIDYQANYIQAYRDENEQQRKNIATLLWRLERRVTKDYFNLT